MRKALALILALAMFAGCSTTTVCKDFNGLGTPAGNAKHLSTSNMALHLLMNKPLKGDATLEKTVADFTAAAKKEGATKVSICQSNRNNLWYILFPFTIFVTPVITNVAGDAIS